MKANTLAPVTYRIFPRSYVIRSTDVPKSSSQGRYTHVLPAAQVSCLCSIMIVRLRKLLQNRFVFVSMVFIQGFHLLSAFIFQCSYLFFFIIQLQFTSTFEWFHPLTQISLIFPVTVTFSNVNYPFVLRSALHRYQYKLTSTSVIIT